MFWSATNGRVYTGLFMNRTKLNNVTHQQVINGFPWQQLVIGMSLARCGNTSKYEQNYQFKYSSWQMVCDQLS